MNPDELDESEGQTQSILDMELEYYSPVYLECGVSDGRDLLGLRHLVSDLHCGDVSNA